VAAGGARAAAGDAGAGFSTARHLARG
jgi:hypothetical protein